MLIRIVTCIWGDPLIVARTVLKLSNGVAAARPPFFKPAACKFLKHDPGTLLIDWTKYASGVPGETLSMYSIYVQHARIKERIAATAVKARRSAAHAAHYSRCVRWCIAPYM